MHPDLVAAARHTLQLIRNARFTPETVGSYDGEFVERATACADFARSLRQWPASHTQAPLAILFEQYAKGYGNNPFDRAKEQVHYVLGDRECGWAYLD